MALVPDEKYPGVRRVPERQFAHIEVCWKASGVGGDNKARQRQCIVVEAAVLMRERGEIACGDGDPRCERVTSRRCISRVGRRDVPVAVDLGQVRSQGAGDADIRQGGDRGLFGCQPGLQPDEAVESLRGFLKHVSGDRRRGLRWDHIHGDFLIVVSQCRMVGSGPRRSPRRPTPRMYAEWIRMGWTLRNTYWYSPLESTRRRNSNAGCQRCVCRASSRDWASRRRSMSISIA